MRAAVGSRCWWPGGSSTGGPPSAACARRGSTSWHDAGDHRRPRPAAPPEGARGPARASASTRAASGGSTAVCRCGARSTRRSASRGWRRSPPAAASRRMVVVGGGVAGAEAAYRAAESGSLVTLFERAGQLGGRARIAAGRHGQQWVFYLTWLGDQLEANGVDVRLNSAPVAGGHSRPGSRRGRHRDRINPAYAGVGGVGPAGPGCGSRRRSRPGSTRGSGAVLVVDDEGGFVAPHRRPSRWWPPDGRCGSPPACRMLRRGSI